MDDLSVIDRFMQTFIRYIDSGFGLLGGDVHFLSVTLIGIDVTLAGLFWALGGEDDIVSRLIRKSLYVGAFAFILNNFSRLADIIFRSFASAGLVGGGGALSADDLLRPGALAGVGYSAAWPLLRQMSQLLGFTTFFDNFVTIAVLFFAWIFVILSFFVLAIQVFVTILEFKLTTLAGFILVPFALWNRTSFLAERVLGNVVSSGVKVMVLAVIVGIGSNFFSEFVASAQGQEPDIAKALSLVLAALTLLGLGIYGPGIATGLVAGAPQLGAGAAVGVAAGAAGTMALGGLATGAAVRGIAGGAAAAMRAGTSMGAAASTAYTLGQEAAGSSSARAGFGGIGRAASNTVRSHARSAIGLDEATASGRRAARDAFGSARAGSAQAGTPRETRPEWASSLERRQTARHHGQLAAHTLRDGDGGGGGANPDLDEKED